MELRVKFDFEYSEEDDVLSIFDYNKPISETLEFNEFINVDLGENDEIVGLEIFDVSKFLGVLNKGIDKDFIKSVKSIEIVQANYRNNILIAIVLNSDNKQIYQQLPPLRKGDYVSPLIASVSA